MTFKDPSGIVFVIGHALKVMVFYFMYKGIIEVALKTPYIHLFNELNEYSSNLSLKDSQLRATVEKLEKEREHRKNIEEILLRKEIEKLKEDAEQDKKLLKETQEFNKLITEFFANISHELKTPLNVIFSAVQLLTLYNKNDSEEYNSEKWNSYLKVMKQNCYRLLRLVNNLIDITRFDSGYFSLNLKNLNIVNIAEDITQSVVEYVNSKGIRIIFDTDVEEKIIACDPDKIERILLSLISNAVKFTNKGDEIFVTVKDGGTIVSISVKDTGIGIPEDKLEFIFQRFGQVDKAIKRNREGSGIGLSLVKSMVEIQGGSISLKSKEGVGSEFIIELPVRTVYENERTAEEFMCNSNVERVNIEFQTYTHKEELDLYNSKVFTIIYLYEVSYIISNQSNRR